MTRKESGTIQRNSLISFVSMGSSVMARLAQSEGIPTVQMILAAQPSVLGALMYLASQSQLESLVAQETHAHSSEEWTDDRRDIGKLITVDVNRPVRFCQASESN